MGNCQAVDNASFILQTPNRKTERFYSPISAAEIMNIHPDHHVALLLTTTVYSAGHHHQPPNNHPLRVTRIKLLRPTDNLVLGHVYKLITTQEVMNGLKAKKTRNLNSYRSFQAPEFAGKSESYRNCEAAATKCNQSGKTHQQMKKEDKHEARKSRFAGGKLRGWHPSLNSISEATS